MALLLTLNILLVIHSISFVAAGNYSQQYIIVTCDTCYQVSLNDGMSITSFKNINPGFSCNQLQSNTSARFVRNAANCSDQYTVVSGDICYQVSLSNGISLTSFKNINPGFTCNDLQNSVRFLRSAGNCSHQYTVVGGDTCNQIALTYGISLSALKDMNPGINCNYLQIGQSVCV